MFSFSLYVIRWLGVVSHKSRSFPRPLRVLSLVMNILVVLFLEAITYNMADPNDGSCENASNVAECLHEKSSLAQHESMCYWRDDNETCHFREVDQEFNRIIVVAVIVAVVGTPLALAIEALILRYLAAEVVNLDDQQHHRFKVSSSSVAIDPYHSDKVAHDSVAVVKKFHRSVMMLRRAEEALGNTAEDEFNALQVEMERYKSTLCKKEQRVFDGNV